MLVSRGDDCVLDVDRWDFDWQLSYFLEEPIDVQRGETISLHCTFDTRGETEVIRWGEGTGDEMCLAFFYVTA